MGFQEYYRIYATEVEIGEFQRRNTGKNCEGIMWKSKAMTQTFEGEKCTQNKIGKQTSSIWCL